MGFLSELGGIGTLSAAGLLGLVVLLIMRDGMKLGAAGDAFVKRAAANTTNVGRLAVENVSGSGAAMPSSAWRKLEIFDAAGVSVGFIPIFQSL